MLALHWYDSDGHNGITLWLLCTTVPFLDEEISIFWYVQYIKLHKKMQIWGQI